jgi:adenylosuccinate lyase
VLAIIATSIERFATEIRHLQRTEVLEVEEYFAAGQKGSSAMPHKRNPVLSENLCGLARVVRGVIIPAMENVVLWHERDISHSSVERIIAPEATITLDFAIARLTGLVENLTIHSDNIATNLNKLSGLVFSQRVLLTLIEYGISREVAYSLVQKHAMNSWQSGEDFKELLTQDSELKQYISASQINGLFDVSYHIKNIDFIYKKVFNNSIVCEL